MVEVLKDHLFISGIDKGYIRWIRHGESASERPITSDDRRCDEKEDAACSESDELEDMIHDIEEYFMDRQHLFKSLKDDAEKSLYVVCSKFTNCLQC